MVSESAVRKTISDREMAVTKRRRIATANTRQVCDGSAVNSEPPEATLYIRPRRQRITLDSRWSSPMTRPEMEGTSRGEVPVTSTDDAGVKDESPKTKAPRLEVQESRTAGPTDACEASAASQAPAAFGSKGKDTGMRKPTGRGQRHRATVRDELGVHAFQDFGARQRDVENGVCRWPPEMLRTRSLHELAPTLFNCVRNLRQEGTGWQGRPRQAYTVVRPKYRIGVTSTQLCPSLFSPPSDRNERCG
ncbi:hypothetical protein MTO96_013270 [Rhipicephalus appendiculatus]